MKPWPFALALLSDKTQYILADLTFLSINSKIKGFAFYRSANGYSTLE